MKISWTTWIVIAIIVLWSMSMQGKGGGGTSAWGALWTSEMANSNAIVNELDANCQGLLQRLLAGECGRLIP